MTTHTPCKQPCLAFLIPFAIATAVTLVFYRLPNISMDGQIYIQIARNIHYGIGLGWQALWFPPLHSVLIALAGWLPGVPDLQAAAGIVSPMMGVLLSVAVYFLAAGMFNRTVAIAAAIITAAFPHFVFMSFSSEAEITYTTLLTTSLALLTATAKRESLPLAILAGILFSLSYLARSEGFLVMVITLAVLCAGQGIRFYRSALARLCAVVLVTFFIVSSPYLLFLKKHYGSFVISPKSTYVLTWMKSRIYHDNGKGEIFNDELWGLTPEGKLKWQQPSGISDLAAYLMSHPRKSLDVYLHNLSLEIPGRIPNNSGTQHFPQVFPVYMVLAALIFAFGRGKGEHAALNKTILFAPLLLLLILPVFTEGWWKYLAPYAPLLIIAACAGLHLATEWMLVKARPQNSSRNANLAIAAFAVILSLHYLSLNHQKTTSSPKSESDTGRGNYAEEARKAATYARHQFGPGRNYMVAWNKMIYYLDGLWTPEPITDNDQLLKFARNNNVDYIIKEALNRKVTNEEIMAVPPGVRFEGVYSSSQFSYAAVFYRLIR